MGYAGGKMSFPTTYNGECGLSCYKYNALFVKKGVFGGEPHKD